MDFIQHLNFKSSNTFLKCPPDMTWLLNCWCLPWLLKFQSCIKIISFNVFCVEFQRVSLKFHTKYLTHTLKDVGFTHRWKFKSSYVFFKCHLTPNHSLTVGERWVLPPHHVHEKWLLPVGTVHVVRTCSILLWRNDRKCKFFIFVRNRRLVKRWIMLHCDLLHLCKHKNQFWSDHLMSCSSGHHIKNTVHGVPLYFYCDTTFSHQSMLKAELGRHLQVKSSWLGTQRKGWAVF